MARVDWKIAGASVVGFSHSNDGSPCQDAHAVAITATGWFIGVVSDGAGSAARSQEGSQIICRDLVSYVSARLLELPSGPENSVDEHVVRKWIENGIEAVRERLSTCAMAAGGLLSDFHATIVGAVANSTGGMFFHVGDGAGCAVRFGELTDYVMTYPENGEYANETYFITEDSWREHLRLTRFGPQYQLIALMTDGVTPFALARGSSGPFGPFLEPLSEFLAKHSREEGEQALVTTLGKEAIRRITQDDKTLLWALRVDHND